MDVSRKMPSAPLCDRATCSYCSADAETVRRRAGGMTSESRARVLAGRIVELPGAACVLGDGRVMSIGESWRVRRRRPAGPLDPGEPENPTHALRGVMGRPGPNGYCEPMAEFVTSANGYGRLSFDAILSIPPDQWERVDAGP